MFRKRLHRSGALLIEVLIATTILATGVVTSLTVFSGALSASNRSVKMKQAHQLVDERFFKWFLDPTSFDPASADLLARPNEKTKMVSRVSLQKLELPGIDSEPEDAATQGAPKLRSPIASTVEFYEAEFRIDDLSQKPLFRNYFYLAQYGKQKKS